MFKKNLDMLVGRAKHCVISIGQKMTSKRKNSCSVDSSYSFNDYQTASEHTAIYPNKGNNVVYPTLGLNGEAGEVAEKVKKLIRDTDGVITEEFRCAIKKELGDCMWYISAMCHELGLSMEDVAMTNIEKLTSRMERNRIGGSGDNR